MAALVDFALLAAEITGGAARIEMRDGPIAETGSLGEPVVESPIVHDGATLGRLLVSGPNASSQTVAAIVRRIAAYVGERRTVEEGHEAHEAAIGLMERANDIARSAAHRFEALFDGIPVACYACDAEGRLMEWNRAAEERWGATIAMAWGQDPSQIVAIEEADAERDLLVRALAGEKARTRLASSFPLFGSQDEVVGAIVAHLEA